MADLTAEEFEQVPDFLKKDYKEVDGVYKNIAVMTVKNTANNLDADLKAERAASAKYKEQLSSIEELNQRQLKEAHDKALETARAENKHDVVLKLEREKLEDERKILQADREGLELLQTNNAKDKKKNIADRLTKSATEEGAYAFNALIQGRIAIDPKTQEKTFLNADGSASSVTDEAEFLKTLEKDKVFMPLMKVTAFNQNGGLLNGGLDSRASNKKPKDMTGSERLQLKKDNPALFKKLFNV